MKKIILLSLVFALLLLCGCGRKNKASEPETTPEPTATEEIPAEATPTPVPEDYDTIDEVSSSLLQQLRSELNAAGDACVDLYASADKGNALNVVLSDETIQSMVYAIASLGYPVIDYLETMDMQNPDSVAALGAAVSSSDDVSCDYFNVFDDGHISLFHLSRENGSWYMITLSLQWTDDSTHEIYSEGRYQLSEVRYTDKGRLFYNRNFSSFDDNQKSNSDSWVMVKVSPTDSTKKSLCSAYISPIGYFENNLFTTTWDSSNMVPIDFNSLYAFLFSMYTGETVLTSYNVYNYYTPVTGTTLYLIPTDTFEKVVHQYFDIDSAVLKAISDYSSSRDGYYFLGYRLDYYNITPRTPSPEVVDYRYNSDGTLTMRVDAVNTWYGTDTAFSHEVTVAVNSDGSFRYISNTLYTDENSILPEARLSDLLSAQLKLLG